ncbi:MlaD family protein [Oceanihabitans sediminis]|uniref:MCE family protein n=1 Tax=Oceanihabitans sediminis TaxID=1812012 RepID=A0A368P6Z4_9FLAO|nr:MlaD family protein [Oceanihabitans sediminis]MDX1278496.1 MlaD family protein [Oceanihabitans sediminis]MDX1772534.1 MlaD family protein [Oceanihabitans sediminis]RBP34183.1 phospholipid/cholesterol/gamma-HCH transport system substrate-binding protein [Oceanihabitans sediminis]RCU57874.1 MCE family protein [Oceanihabitans sediminis]
MKKSTNQKLKLGVFVILGSLIFITAIYFIGERQNIFAKTFTIGSNFNNVNGLMKGNNVRYSGINVGTVKDITMVNDSTINVSMFIEERMQTHIKKNAIATIGSDGLVGNMIVNIIPGSGTAEIISDGDTIKSYSKIGTNEMLNTLNTTNENAALLTSKLLDIANEITSGKGTLGMLINDTIASNDLKQTINYLKLASLEANKTIVEINALVANVDMENSVAGVMLNNEAEAQKVKDMITNLNQSSQDIKLVIDNLNETITKFKEGDGALNYITTDKELVESLKASMENINEGTDKFNQNMEALKHNFLTRGYFRKLERQEKRAAKKQD